jgi:hypothetical protein
VLAILISLAFSAQSDAPFTPRLVAQVEPAGPLASARKLADALRYEEAVVEYQRYLGSAGDRPAKERAAALFELGFIQLVLGDEANAKSRATEALELDPALSLPPSAPQRQVDFLSQVRRELSSRARLTVQARQAGDGPQLVRAKLFDPERKVKRVLLRHALSANGPFWASPMRCSEDDCRAELPSPAQGGDFTAWYFVEALDAKEATVASGASAREPLQLSVVASRPWYQSPVVWGVTGAALVAAGVVLYLLATPPPQ